MARSLVLMLLLAQSLAFLPNCVAGDPESLLAENRLESKMSVLLERLAIAKLTAEERSTIVNTLAADSPISHSKLAAYILALPDSSIPEDKLVSFATDARPEIRFAFAFNVFRSRKQVPAHVDALLRQECESNNVLRAIRCTFETDIKALSTSCLDASPLVRSLAVRRLGHLSFVHGDSKEACRSVSRLLGDQDQLVRSNALYSSWLMKINEDICRAAESATLDSRDLLSVEEVFLVDAVESNRMKYLGNPEYDDVIHPMILGRITSAFPTTPSPTGFEEFFIASTTGKASIAWKAAVLLRVRGGQDGKLYLDELRKSLDVEGSRKHLWDE